MALVLALSFLTACSSTLPTKTITTTVTQTKRIAVKPPDNLLASCPDNPSDGTIGGELQRMSSLIKCERDKEQALDEWYKNVDANE